MELTFYTKNDKQLLAAEAWVDSTIEEILYGGGKGGGKSYLGAALIFGAAHTFPETHWFIARKELIDLKKFTIPTIYEVHKNWGLNIENYLKFDGQLNVFTLPNKSKVFLIACADIPSDPLFERFGSMQMTGGWIEEAGEIAEAAKANLRLSIGRWKNDIYNLTAKLLITANPKKGWLKRDFVDPFKSGVLPKTRCYIQALVTDNPYLPQTYIDTLLAEKDPVRRQRLVEGNWDYDETQDSLITFDNLTDAFSNTIVKDGQKYMTVDVARLGRDSTVISIWDGLEQTRIEKYEKQATNETERIIKDLAAAERVPFSNILIDEDGIGGGVVDHLFGVKGFTANSVPMPTATEIKERYAKIDLFLVQKRDFSNIKAQCGWKLAELINEHKIRLLSEQREAIIEDLTSMLRAKNPDGDGKKQLRSKDDVKLEIGHSPDTGDTILMRAWFELKKIALNESPEKAFAFQRQANQFQRNKGSQSSNSTK